MNEDKLRRLMIDAGIMEEKEEEDKIQYPSSIARLPEENDVKSVPVQKKTARTSVALSAGDNPSNVATKSSSMVSLHGKNIVANVLVKKSKIKLVTASKIRVHDQNTMSNAENIDKMDLDRDGAAYNAEREENHILNFETGYFEDGAFSAVKKSKINVGVGDNLSCKENFDALSAELIANNETVKMHDQDTISNPENIANMDLDGDSAAYNAECDEKHVLNFETGYFEDGDFCTTKRSKTDIGVQDDNFDALSAEPITNNETVRVHDQDIVNNAAYGEPSAYNAERKDNRILNFETGCFEDEAFCPAKEPELVEGRDINSPVNDNIDAACFEDDACCPAKESELGVGKDINSPFNDNIDADNNDNINETDRVHPEYNISSEDIGNMDIGGCCADFAADGEPSTSNTQSDILNFETGCFEDVDDTVHDHTVLINPETGLLERVTNIFESNDSTEKKKDKKKKEILTHGEKI